VKLVGHLGTAYPKAVRAAVLQVMEGEPLPAAEMSRLNWRLGSIYADCVGKAAAEFGVKVGLVGCHGQTVHHEPTAARYFGAAVRSTWQIGEAAVISERLRCPVVSDFRPADLAAGGQGAPLVPMLDWCMFRSAKVSRVLQNLGGIGNLTVVPAGCDVNALMAFDTGPANMVIDGCMATLLGKKFDRDGAVARRGRVLREVVKRLMRDRYFSALPPKSCGREEFGAVFTTRLISMCREAGGTDADAVATATALTAESILDAYRRFVWAHVGTAAPMAKVEFCVAGGGTKNGSLMGMLREGFAELGVRVRLMEELGVPAQAKEAVAFALLGWLTWSGLAGNVPAATGASHSAVLGKVSYG
jgi:anhydro-N-acetylmuramic acid kinase